MQKEKCVTPDKGVIAYKLLRVRRDKTLGPLFINRHQVISIGEWIPAKDHPTKGFKHRPFWHCAPKAFAPHLTMKNRVWMKVEISDFTEFPRPHIQGGAWLLAKWMKVLGVVPAEEIL